MKETRIFYEDPQRSTRIHMSHVSHARTRCPGWTHKCQQTSNAEAPVQTSSDEAQARLSSPLPVGCSTADCSSSCASCSPTIDGGKSWYVAKAETYCWCRMRGDWQIIEAVLRTTRRRWKVWPVSYAKATRTENPERRFLVYIWRHGH